jgi:hypothetical protein
MRDERRTGRSYWGTITARWLARVEWKVRLMASRIFWCFRSRLAFSSFSRGPSSFRY